VPDESQVIVHGADGAYLMEKKANGWYLR
jgi:hypothetical protein